MIRNLHPTWNARRFKIISIHMGWEMKPWKGFEAINKVIKVSFLVTPWLEIFVNFFHFYLWDKFLNPFLAQKKFNPLSQFSFRYVFGIFGLIPLEGFSIGSFIQETWLGQEGIKKVQEVKINPYKRLVIMSFFNRFTVLKQVTIVSKTQIQGACIHRYFFVFYYPDCV